MLCFIFAGGIGPGDCKGSGRHVLGSYSMSLGVYIHFCFLTVLGVFVEEIYFCYFFHVGICDFKIFLFFICFRGN